MCRPKNLLKTWAKFKPVTRHHSWQRGMSDFDMYILPLLWNKNENYYCWSSMIMSSYFNVQYLHQKMIRIYADIVQNHTLPGVFPNFWRAVYMWDYWRLLVRRKISFCSPVQSTRNSCDILRSLVLFKVKSFWQVLKHLLYVIKLFNNPFSTMNIVKLLCKCLSRTFESKLGFGMRN